MEEATLSSLTTSQPWWRTDDYHVGDALPVEFEEQCGPKGVALVKAWPDGKTDIGWGLVGPKHEPEKGFMPRYLHDDFNSRRVLYGYEKDKWAFAIVMRSVRLVCIDIDGKNGGLEHAKRLGLLPPTMAETSKSGNGFHLFYLHEEPWDPETGFGALTDHIGIEQGVDIRSVGCVYHHKQQRWNGRDISSLPQHLKDLMLARRQRTEHNHARVAGVLASGDDMEILMLHDELVNDLKKPIGQGKRNTTLFAIGQKMKAAGVPDWPTLISDRAVQVGLDHAEADQLVKNISTYQ
jgi:hypothetical protein